MTEYFSEMKNLADEMSSSGQPLGDKKFVSYVLTGLDGEIYNLLVSSIITEWNQSLGPSFSLRW
jgi:hypothetical protein